MVSNWSTTSNTSAGSRGFSPPRGMNRKYLSQNQLNVTGDKRVIRSRGTSPSKTENGFMAPSSRGSDFSTESIERLDENTNTHRIISTYHQAEDNINVCVRVRPLSVREINAGDSNVIQFPGNGQLLVESVPTCASAQKPKLFSYNVVFEPAATQEDVLQFSGVKRLLEMAVEGFRCTAFCYGQTGSGKTHTLTGPPRLFDRKPVLYSDLHGLVFRSFLYLFKLLKDKSDVHFILKASFLEIYNEKVIDLLNTGTARKPLAVRWSKKARGFFVENLFTVDCEELDDLTAVLEEGMRNRSVGRHNMNEYSSRSHTILTVHITSEQPAEKGVFISRSGKINFVDLAGSEMTKKTHSEGKTLEEANNINKSLMVLGYCIASLSDTKRRNNHIPYRDSQLTKLLADSLAGNGVTLMIACISPAKSNLTETINTLRYAARAKKIRTKPIVLMDPREALIISLKREVGALQSENEHLRSVLHLQGEHTPEKLLIATPPKVNLEKLGELEGPELIELVKLYVAENEALRKENMELFVSREVLLRDQELVCRENERLLKKLEDVNSVCCRSPLTGNKPSGQPADLNKSMVDLDMSFSNIWTSPTSPSQTTLPEVIQKELSKRRIGDSFGTVSESIARRVNSLDDLRAASNPVRIKSSDSTNNILQPLADRRFSMAKSPVKRTSTLSNGHDYGSGSQVTSPISLGDSLRSISTEWNGSPQRRNSKEHSNGNSGIFGSTVSLVDN